MPRQARIDYPGALHHVIGRGIERRAIFQEEADKEAFLQRIKNQLFHEKRIGKTGPECVNVFGWEIFKIEREADGQDDGYKRSRCEHVQRTRAADMPERKDRTEIAGID